MDLLKGYSLAIKKYHMRFTNQMIQGYLYREIIIIIAWRPFWWNMLGWKFDLPANAAISLYM